MRAAGARGIDDLRRSSVDDIAGFWDLVVRDLDLRFRTPYTRVLDDSDGIEWARWFVHGRVNVTEACVDRWREDPASAGRPALVAESEAGEVRVLSFRELGEEVDRLTGALRALGVGPGDPVGVFMPMVPEAVVAAYAVAKAGGVYVPIFSGFAAAAIAS